MARDPGIRDARLTRLLPGGARRAVMVAAPLASAALASCGSSTLAELPPPATPDRSPATTVTPAGTVSAINATNVPAALREDTGTATLRDGRLRLTVDPKARTVRLQDAASGRTLATKAAGVGPTHVRCSPDGPCFVIDTQGDAVLVFRVGADDRSLRLTRRVYVAGAPYATAIDPQRARLWVTLSARNELVELGAHGRPHILQRLPTVRQPDAVSVDAELGTVSILGAGPVLQRITDPASGDR